jgi:hypothetical protein
LYDIFKYELLNESGSGDLLGAATSQRLGARNLPKYHTNSIIDMEESHIKEAMLGQDAGLWTEHKINSPFQGDTKVQRSKKYKLLDFYNSEEDEDYSVVEDLMKRKKIYE